MQLKDVVDQDDLKEVCEVMPAEEFEEFYNENCQDFFPMVHDYLEKDRTLYLNDDKIVWVVVFESSESFTPVGILGIKTHQAANFEGFKHIAVYEISSDTRGTGYGKIILNALTSKDNWSLYAETKNDGFYEKCGFTKQEAEGGCHTFLKSDSLDIGDHYFENITFRKVYTNARRLSERQRSCN